MKTKLNQELGIANQLTYLTIHENLKHHVSVRPDKVAIIYEDRLYTFKQVYEDVRRIAYALRKQGIRQGNRVGIYLRNHWSYILLYYALSRIGAVAVPLNYMLRADQLKVLFDFTGCKFLFAEMNLYEEVKEMTQQGTSAIPMCFVDDSPDEKINKLNDWLNLNVSDNEPDIEVNINDPMMILFSSGTTGLPKGIVLSHLNRILYFFELGMEYGIRYNEVNLCSTPLYHNAAIFFAFNNLYFGSTTVIHRKFDVEQTFLDIERYRVTNAFFVPAQLHQLVHSEERKKYNLSSLRVVVSGAAPLATPTKESILKCFPGVELHELYGLTETGLITNLRPEDQLRKARCAGSTFLNMQFRVVGENGNDVKPGEVGEIITHGPTLFDGYYGDQDATSKAWRNGWFYTGDLGNVDEDGFLYIVDRLKDMIISGGANIYPKDIEDAIYTIEQVRDVAVIGIPDEKWGESVHAVVVCHDGTSLTAEDVISVCKSNLAAYQVPRSVEFRNELPRNPSGKLLKRVLREEFWKHQQVKV